MDRTKNETFSKNLIVTMDDFSGPLELLYQLIIERKKNILDLKILDIANVFIDYVKNNINLIELDSIIDSLLMVTHLIELKSKRLLPIHETGKNVDSEIERDKFIQRVLMYKKFKDVIPHFEEKFQERKTMITRDDFDDHEDLKTQIVEELPDFVPTSKLLRAMQNVYREMVDRKKFQSIVNIGIKELSIDDITKQILQVILDNQENNKITLRLLLNSIPEKQILTKQYFAVSFVALLVLTRNGLISLHQDFEIDSDIYIKIINLNLSYELEEKLERKENIDAEVLERAKDE